MSTDRKKELEHFCLTAGLDSCSPELLDNALTHRSFTHEMDLPYEASNERLEFLGDAVLQICVSEALFKGEPSMKERPMSKIRAITVCEQSLAKAARSISLGDFLLLGKGEEFIGGRDGDANLANALEAVIGAVYLDMGLEKSKNFVKNILGETFDLARRGKLFFDYKSRLIEMIQEMQEDHKIEFVLKDSMGPVHNPTFVMAVLLDGKEMATGKARSKKKAEQIASRLLLEQLNELFLKADGTVK